MQALTAAPRSNLTAAQVEAVLQSPSLSVDFGCELLDANLNVTEDISAEFEGGSREWVLGATVHGTCRLSMTRELAWGVDLVRPYRLLTDPITGVTARFNRGVYCLTTPEDVFGESVRTFQVTGADRLYLLDREVGDSYRVAAGTSYLTAVRDVITAAGLSGVLLDGTSTKTLPVDRLWPFVPTGTDGKADQPGTTTWLRIVNDLLDAINYRGIWADENGLFRSEPYVAPSARTAEYAFTADDPSTTLMGQSRTRVQDRWKAPNRWVFVQRNLPGDPPPVPAEGAGIYTVPNSTGGLTRTRTVVLDAAGQDELVAQGDRIVANDRRVSTLLRVSTAPFPLAGHADVYSYTDADLGGTLKVQAVQWTEPLGAEDMTWAWEVVT